MVCISHAAVVLKILFNIDDNPYSRTSNAINICESVHFHIYLQQNASEAAYSTYSTCVLVITLNTDIM